MIVTVEKTYRLNVVNCKTGEFILEDFEKTFEMTYDDELTTDVDGDLRRIAAIHYRREVLPLYKKDDNYRWVRDIHWAVNVNEIPTE